MITSSALKYATAALTPIAGSFHFSCLGSVADCSGIIQMIIKSAIFLLQNCGGRHCLKNLPEKLFHVGCSAGDVWSAPGADGRLQAWPENIWTLSEYQSHEKPFDYFSVKSRVSCLHWAQTRCPFVHWKMLVGGPISSRHTCTIVQGMVT